ncbi:MAG: hypothetical protein LUC41_02760 [Clostridiales bacterium]|nr:hypothetical protein [Clostridiales bacterium]
MNEKPIEWISTVGEFIGHKICRFACLVLMIVSAVLFFLSMTLLPMFAAIVFLFLFIFLHLRNYLEYEFMYISGELRITTIYNQRRRKKKAVIPLDKIERMTKRINDADRPEYLCPRAESDGIYALSYNSGEEGRRIIVIEADPEFVKLMQMRRKIY